MEPQDSKPVYALNLTKPELVRLGWLLRNLSKADPQLKHVLELIDWWLAYFEVPPYHKEDPPQ